MENEIIECEKILGIIYCYTCKTTQKKYIGQTTNEKRRRAQFRWKTNYCKGGDSAIDNARRRYGTEDFEYIVLEEYFFENVNDATKKLDEREQYYIKLYDTYMHGYNSTIGGHTNRGKKWTAEQLNKIRGENHWNYGKRYEYKEKPQLYKSISVYSKDGTLLETCKSQKEAAKKYNVEATNVAKVCKGKLKTTGGYIFKYANTLD